MGEVIDLSTFTNRKVQGVKARGNELTKLLNTATIMARQAEEIKGAVAVMDFAGLKRVFEARLSEIILSKKNIGVDFFLCGNYVAALLTEIGKASPESWFAVDYFIKAAVEDNPSALKQGANVCFLICAVFPRRGQIRCMKPADYEVLGRGMFFGYYDQTGVAVAYFMGKQFKDMVEITKECFLKLK